MSPNTILLVEKLALVALDGVSHCVASHVPGVYVMPPSDENVMDPAHGVCVWPIIRRCGIGASKHDDSICCFILMLKVYMVGTDR